MMILIGENAIGPKALATMRERGGSWAAYQNSAPGHPEIALIRFLKYGKGCTFSVPPNRHPDGHGCVGWSYLYVGNVNLETGKIEEAE